MRSTRSSRLFSGTAAVLLAAAATVQADIDNLVTLVPANVASGGTTNSLGSYGYIETSDGSGGVVKTFYTATFGSGAALRKIVEGSPTATTILTEGDLAIFYRNGDTTRGVTTPTISGIITNPAAVGSFASNGGLWITDIETTRVPGGASTADPAASKRLYRYNLQPVPVGGDGRDVLTTLTTSADINAAAGAAATATNNFGRQAAFSPNGQTIYAIDTSVSAGGVYKINPVTGATSRILDISGSATGAARLANEPAVQRVGNADRILISGNQISSALPNNNVGGLNYVDYDGTTVSAQQTLVSQADLQSFLQTTAATEVRAVAAASDGTIFFWEGQATSRMIARDPQGRLYKVTTRNERDLTFTGSTTTTPAPSNSVLRLQTRTITDPTAGPITQLMYAESTPLNFVAGVNVYKPTDFNRDGVENTADMTQFGAVLTPVNVAATLANARYDLNGNGSIDFRDVKIAQSFQLFPDGDANFDKVVEFTDLVALAQHYSLSTGQTWLTGDFNGDDSVDFADLVILAQNYNSSPAITPGDFGSSFAADWALAQSLAPEPATLGMLAAVGTMLVRRRR